VIAYTIDLLAAANPSSPLPNTRFGVLQQEHKKHPSPFTDACRDRFITKYTKTGFGWYIALQFANRGLELPVLLSGRDTWVFKAWLMNVDPWGHYNEHVAEAYHLAKFVKGSPNLRQHLKALLMSFRPAATAESHLKEVSLKTGVSVATLDAFEILFFNIIDRRDAFMYLGQEVYPNGRGEEFDEGYLKSVTQENLIKRVAYNHRDMDLTAYLAGLGDNEFISKMAASADREAALTRFLMGNGLLLAHSNLLNQKNVGVSRASTLLAAARQAGTPQEEPTLTGIVPMYNDAFQLALSANRELVVEQMQRDSGVLDI
jgi:hypothetical protein